MEAIRGDLTLAESGAKYGIDHTMIAEWKRQAIDGMTSTFAGASNVARASGERRDKQAAFQDWATGFVTGFFSPSLRSMSVDRRRGMIEWVHDHLSISAQCRLMSISGSSFNFVPQPESDETLALMRVIDAAFLDMPWYGSRQVISHLRR